MSNIISLREYERRKGALPMVIESSDGERSYGFFMNFSEKGGLYEGNTLLIPKDGYFFFTVAAGSFGSLTGQARSVTDLKGSIGFIYDDMSDLSYRSLRNLVGAHNIPWMNRAYKAG